MVVDVDQTMIRNPSWWRRRTRLERRVIRVAVLLAFVNVALVITIALVLTKRGYQAASRWKHQMGPVCLTPACTSLASSLLRDMHLHENPCDNFYKFTCGGFVDRTAVPDDESVYDFFIENSFMLEEQLKDLLEAPSNSTDLRPFVLLRNLYNSCMNTSAIENEGLLTLRSILYELGGWPVVVNNRWVEERFDWQELMYKLRRFGFKSDYLLSVDVADDDKNTSRYLIILDEANMEIYEHYLIEGFENKIVQAYYEYAVDIAVLLGADRNIAREELKQSVEFEVRLTDFTQTYQDVRNLTGLYNPMTIKELQNKFPEIPWLKFITKMMDVPHIEVTENETVDVSVPRYIGNLIELLAKTPKRVVANYMIWRLVASAVPYITENFTNRLSEFDEAIDGHKKAHPRWKQCLYHASENMQIALNGLYVRKHSSKAIKTGATELTNSIRNEFINSLKKIEWMDETTRTNAMEKAAAMNINMAYPNELLNDTKLEEYYSELKFTSNNYLEMILKLKLFATNKLFGELRKPFKKNSWIRDAAEQSVDAQNKFDENRIVVGAGLLQGVFYGKDRPQYINYGSLGSIIGHEITHGFDSEGSAFDKNGNLANWWAPTTKDIFRQKAQCIIEQYNNFTVPSTKQNINGFNTQEENIADNGGVRTAYLAYKTWMKYNSPEFQLPGLDFTPSQMFWIAAGHTWCAVYRNEYLKLEVDTDRHSPNFYRVIGPLRNSEQFSKDFNCPVGTKMNPRDKCRIW